MEKMESMIFSKIDEPISAKIPRLNYSPREDMIVLPMPEMTAPVAPFCGSCGDSCEPVKTVAAAVGFMISDGGEADDGAAAQDENSAIHITSATIKQQILFFICKQLSFHNNL